MKICSKCKQEKTEGEFYRHPYTADRLLAKCKECTKRDVHANRVKRIDYYRAYDVLRAKTPKRKAAAAAIGKRWLHEDKRRTRAHNMLTRAVRAGKIIPTPCERCGRQDIHGHHDDYDKPLDVMWLCPACHRARHAELNALKRSF